MFSKILIANRSEIACRIIKTARRMGVRTVAVYSDADASSLHVKLADEAVRIGPSPVTESYLVGSRIIEAALQTGAQAIHPGYGFLSENPDFVEAVEAANLVFIGPGAKSIRAMGLKDAAKALMQEAGVPVVPGYHGENQDPDFLAGEADAIGYPVLIKARAGGGGKGMRLVEAPGQFKAALESAQREGKNAFGDPAVLIEKYITSPRHIEVQVFGDSHGNVVHLFERDCSLQRRHQKVIEEAPAPGMPEAVRAAMTDAAVTAARAINYLGAGTIEFIVDGSGSLREDGFWFMEMNTRLQVEHPVTEAVTGLDLVEWQLRVAAGEPLPLRQEEISLHGHAFEARLYAEDARNDFLPATGLIEHLSFGPGRIDTGVEAKDTITPFYDPMIAKVITHGRDREEALHKLAQALRQTHVAGTVTNRDFLVALCDNATFAEGRMDTGLIGREIDSLVSIKAPPALVVAFAGLAALDLDLESSATGWRLWGEASHRIRLVCDHEVLEGRLVLPGAGSLRFEWQGEPAVLENVRRRGTRYRAVVAGRAIEADVVVFSQGRVRRVSILHDGHTFMLDVPDALSVAEDSEAGGNAIVAAMTGIVQLVDVSVGDEVKLGERLLVMEAMKMEHSLKAPRDAVIAAVHCAPGDAVDGGAVLIAFEEEDA